MDTSKSAEEQVAAAAEKALQKFIDDAKTPVKDAKKIAKVGGSVLELLPALVDDISNTVKDVDKALTSLDLSAIITVLISLNKQYGHKVPNIIKPLALRAEAEDVTIAGAFVNWITQDALGVNLDPKELENSNVTKTIGELIAFVNQIQLLVALITFVGKLGLGNKWSEKAADFIRSIPGEIGIPFAIGTLLSTIFEQAIGRPIEEAINIQKHPNRLDWRVTKQLLSQHILDKPTADWELEKQGYPKELRNYIVQLDSKQLPISDIQSAWFYGIRTEDEADKYLKGLGYSSDDIDIIKQVYFTHGSSQADSIYRSIARRLFTDNSIGESEFRTILDKANTPKKSIDIEVASIQLEQKYGRLNLSVSAIKRMYLDGAILRPEAKTDLINNGYAGDIADSLINDWERLNPVSPKSLSTAQILKYLVAGPLTVDEARTDLLNIGWRPKDADFLLLHPYVHTPKTGYALVPSTVIQAYVDNVITVDVARTQLQNLHVADSEITYALEVATYRKTQKANPKAPVKRVSEADIKEAFNIGLIDMTIAEQMLITVGYHTEDATFIVVTWQAKKLGATISSTQMTDLSGMLTGSLGGNFIPNSTQTPSFINLGGLIYRVFLYSTSVSAPNGSQLYSNGAGTYYWILNTDPVPPTFKPSAAPTPA